MDKKTVITSGTLLVALLLCCAVAWAGSQPLQTTQWLADHMSDQNLVVIDVRTETNYGVGHIPGAVNLPYAKWEPMDDEMHCQLMPPADDIGAMLRERGVSGSSQVVIYDHGNTISDASKGAAVVWILSTLGHTKISYLNGGFTKWTFEGRIIDNKKPTPVPGDFSAQTDSAKVTDLNGLLSLVKAGKVLLVDARNSNQHFGSDKRADVAAFGHIPGSLNLPAPFLTNAGINRAPATIKEKKELLAIVDGVGISNDKDQKIIVYCNTAQYAGLDYFVLHDLLGYQNVSVYDGSMLDYGVHEELPLASYGWGHVRH